MQNPESDLRFTPAVGTRAPRRRPTIELPRRRAPPRTQRRSRSVPPPRQRFPWGTFVAIAFGAGVPTLAAVISPKLGLLLTIFALLTAGIGCMIAYAFERQRLLVRDAEGVPSEPQLAFARTLNGAPYCRPTLKSAQDPKTPKSPKPKRAR